MRPESRSDTRTSETRPTTRVTDGHVEDWDAEAAELAESPRPRAPDYAVDVDGDGRPDMAMRMRRAGSPTHAGVTASWQDVKSRFVDDPAGAIAEAEALVQRALDDRIRALTDEAAALTVQDGQADDGSATEGLRMRLINYQKYCERMQRDLSH